LERVAHHPGSSLGAAFLAGKSVGVFESWDDIEKFITISEVTLPDAVNHARYRQRFEVYLESYLALQQLYPRLSEPAT
jgi:xylulokinase